MRLIDADKLRKEIHMSYSDDLGIREVINEQPTAYDVDKVVEQLEGLKKECADPLQEYDTEHFIDRAKEIVKSGSIE